MRAGRQSSDAPRSRRADARQHASWCRARRDDRLIALRRFPARRARRRRSRRAPIGTREARWREPRGGSRVCRQDATRRARRCRHIRRWSSPRPALVEGTAQCAFHAEGCEGGASRVEAADQDCAKISGGCAGSVVRLCSRRRGEANEGSGTQRRTHYDAESPSRYAHSTAEPRGCNNYMPTPCARNAKGGALRVRQQRHSPARVRGTGSSRLFMLPSIWNLTVNSAFKLEHGRC